MKKSIIYLLAFVLLITATALSLNSCMHMHDYGEWVIEKEATCTENGIKSKQCQECGNIEKEEIVSSGHTYGIWNTTKEATCFETGNKYRECSCGSKEFEEILKINHTYGEWNVIANPTCAEKGSKERVCFCGEKEIAILEKTTTHTYGEWSVEQEPEVEQEGWKIRKCDICHSEVKEILKPLSPISITSQTYTIDSVGGVEWKTEIRNNTTSTIKYITLKWTCYNAVGDPVYDKIDGKNYVKIRCVGPFDGETTKTYKNATKFYNHAFGSALFNEISVEFIDGRIVDITDEKYAEIFKKTELTSPSFPLEIYNSTNEKYCTITNLNWESCDIDGGGIKNDIMIDFQGSYASLDLKRGNARIELIDSDGKVVYSWKIYGIGDNYYAYNCIVPGEKYTIEFSYRETVEVYFKICPECDNKMYWDECWECSSCEKIINSGKEDNDGFTIVEK